MARGDPLFSAADVVLALLRQVVLAVPSGRAGSVGWAVMEASGSARGDLAKEWGGKGRKALL